MPICNLLANAVDSALKWFPYQFFCISNAITVAQVFMVCLLKHDLLGYLSLERLWVFLNFGIFLVKKKIQFLTALMLVLQLWGYTKHSRALGAATPNPSGGLHSQSFKILIQMLSLHTIKTSTASIIFCIFVCLLMYPIFHIILQASWAFGFGLIYSLL